MSINAADPSTITANVPEVLNDLSEVAVQRRFCDCCGTLPCYVIELRFGAEQEPCPWLSVFWDEGREELERFSRHSRLTPDAASEREGEQIA